MYADCGHEMIFESGVSLGRLILGESLVLGSTKDNSFVAFFVLRVWYRMYHKTLIFFFFFFFFSTINNHQQYCG
jgi:hypothetical protein